MTTIADVARRAGVSKVTVSRVINGAKNVNPETRARVEQAVKELHYVPSMAARSLRSKRTNALALVVPDVTNPFWTTVARGVEDAAQSGGYSILLCNTDENPEKQLHYIDVIISQRVDGVIIAPYNDDPQTLRKLRDRGIPTVLVDRRVRGWEADTVFGDSFSGAYALIRHLFDLGHRRIAMISGSLNTTSAEDRVAGYCVALARAGIAIDPRLIRRGEFKTATGEDLTNQILNDGLRPTAIFAASNAIAFGCITALENHGLRIPQDVALVCFDDIPFHSRLFPFLTVAVQPAYDMGFRSAELMLSRLKGMAPCAPCRIILPTNLILRYSCGRKRDGVGLPLIKDSIPEERREVRTITPLEHVDLADQIPELNLPIY